MEHQIIVIKRHFRLRKRKQRIDLMKRKCPRKICSNRGNDFKDLHIITGQMSLLCYHLNAMFYRISAINFHRRIQLNQICCFNAQLFK